MQKQIVLGNPTNPAELKRLCDYLRELFDFADVIYTEINPNGTLSDRRGKIALYNSSGTYYLYINVDGSTTWRGVGLSLT